MPDVIRPGFTLVEVVMAVAVTTVIMVGIASAMLIAGRALPEGASPAGASVAAAGALEQMMTELQYAVAMNQRSPTVVEFAVADRNGDDVRETIRYEWSGTPGAPLTRCYNGGTAIQLLRNVQDFALTYDVATITSEIPQGNESAQTTLTGYNATQDLHDYPIKDTEWYAQYFLPALPVDAVNWTVTRVVIYAKQDGATDGEGRVQLQTATVGKCPSGVVLEEKTLLESALLSGYLEQEFTFSGAEGFAPQQGLCLVVKWVANGTACKVRGRDKNVTGASLALAKSTTRGAAWSLLSGQSLLFTVYGTVTTTGAPQALTAYYLDGIEVRLQAGGDNQATVQSGVTIPNRPEVTQ